MAAEASDNGYPSKRDAFNLLREALLKTGPPRKAFYRIRLEELSHAQGYVIRKKSGTGDRVTHNEAWYRESFEAALNCYESKIKQKTDTRQKTPYFVEARWKAPFGEPLKVMVEDPGPSVQLPLFEDND